MEMVRSGNRADERCRVERRAHGCPWRPSPRKEARPSQLTGDRVGLGTRRRRTQGALPLSYARPGVMWMWCRAAGFEPATTRLRGEGTPACASGRLGCGASSFRLRGQDSNPDLLVQSQAWCRLHYLASVWMERLELPTPGSQGRCASIAPHPVAGTDGRIRTDTGGGLSAVPLPVGLRQHWWTERESNPQPSPCKGVTLPIAPPARGGGGGDRTRAQGV